MKVLLVNPPLLKYFPSNSCFPPLGLSFLASVLEKYSFEVSILDASAEKLSPEQCVKKILQISPDIVGITSMTPNVSQSIKLAKLIKQKSKILTSIGGPHATFLPEELLKTKYFDYAIRGEGEYTFLELCQFLNKQTKPPDGINGLSFIRKGKIHHNEPRQFIKNLDELPMPAYHLLPFEKYQSMAPPGMIRKKPWLTYCSSRGCPFGCFFCSTSQLWSRTWRAHSVKRFISDTTYLLDRYKLKSIFYCDDNFTFNRQRIIDVCKKIQENKLNFEWVSNCRVDQVDLELLTAMHKSGCWRIGFGIEAGTQEVLNWYGKKFTLEQAKKAIKICKHIGISPICYFIIGAPIETEEFINQTIEFAKYLDPDAVGFSFLVPFPGCGLYNYCADKNLLLTKEWHKYGQDIPVIKSTIPIERLQEINRRAYKEFYFRPNYIIKQFANVIRNPTITWKGFKTVLNWVKHK